MSYAFREGDRVVWVGPTYRPYLPQGTVKQLGHTEFSVEWDVGGVCYYPFEHSRVKMTITQHMQRLVERRDEMAKRRSGDRP